MSKRGWFADWDKENAVGEHGWQPCLETGHGHVPCFEVWFDSEEACNQWIRDNVLGVGLIDDPDSSPSVTPVSENTGVTPQRGDGQ